MLLVDGKKSCFVHYLCKAELSNIRSTADVQINIDISNLGGGGLQQTEISGGFEISEVAFQF